MSATFFPVVLAGGSGTRLWPLSRKNYPKQFLRLQGQFSLLQQTMQRVEQLSPKHALIVSNDAHYFLCQEQLQSLQTTPAITYLLEPCARNTAPAIALAAGYLAAQFGRDALMLVLPSDHWIGDTKAWQNAMEKGAHCASRQDAIVTFGIQPHSAKAGYGYIEAAGACGEGIYHVERFREKPDTDTAAAFIAQGNYFWNSGMFVCRAGVYLDELQRYAPDIASLSAQSLAKACHHHDFIRVDEALFGKCRSESIDYAIMEHTSKAVVIPVTVPWSDLGCWAAVAEANTMDEHGNTLSGNVMAKNSRNCLITSTNALVTTLGIEDQIIVATGDAVLVADKRYSQQVKELVDTLGVEHQALIDDHRQVARPWGYYEILAEGPSFKVKRLMVKPGAKLSLQRHQHRAEHWVVVGGEAEIINDDQTMRLTVNQSTYIPQQTRHRLSNPGTEPLFVIEVQSGSYLGEDDIERFDDIYQRKTPATIT
ncbi:mannose-1-phosphate guanylyltransferase/mannose-6-phosphate isomerase [Legionella spiritensis]|uniref:mannose-1-phosphate guanylyltransferase n=1 Tax=Legionella spiritensis TaxID=452 RepID=A0A0W0YWC9_LEGSP|nr:mannose-1-phosphate guanylyltransferase/mannose-6-phosphate isomerase [Legionella spiritensis]KTD61175.1 mannose-1-phosphate guanylyltransferase [Legionella spiritensis]SNV28518.1 mannose-1-phosphate guanylyltransferase [Legionella spiritensis]